jgi:hypothetical protein
MPLIALPRKRGGSTSRRTSDDQELALLERALNKVIVDWSFG